ncbi:hypothetical protein [Cryptosporangium sp. NPDC051539]|uniref:hypothetical protein n=1 Tax=Cryptosporangium sp. NPDC051539 TaxID=3363962 RepID=UPI003792868C
MNTATALDLITARQTAVTEYAGQLPEQIAKFTAEQLNALYPTIASEPYQQILAVFCAATAPIRAKDVCMALGIEVTVPKDVEGIRAKLKRLVRRQALAEANQAWSPSTRPATKPSQNTLRRG